MRSDKVNPKKKYPPAYYRYVLEEIPLTGSWTVIFMSTVGLVPVYPSWLSISAD